MFWYKQEVVVESIRNILTEVIGCIYAGVKHKLKNFRTNTWIDGTKDRYTPSFVEDVCVVLKATFFVYLHLNFFEFRRKKNSHKF